MKTIVIANQKGGVGKSTTATTLASMLSERGYRTLLIDTDMQCNSTDTYRAETENVATLYDVILADENERIPISEAIQTTEYGSIIASDQLLGNADTIIKNDAVNGIYRLQEALETISSDWDYVIIDTNPTLNSMIYNSLVAADEIIIPVVADRYALAGLSQLSGTIKAIKSRPNKNLKVAGLLLIKYKNQTKLGKQVREDLEKIASQMDTRLFNTTIRETVKVQESQVEREPLIKYAPNSTACIDYSAFVDELLERGN